MESNCSAILGRKIPHYTYEAHLASFCGHMLGSCRQASNLLAQDSSSELLMASSWPERTEILTKNLGPRVHAMGVS